MLAVCGQAGACDSIGMIHTGMKSDALALNLGCVFNDTGYTGSCLVWWALQDFHGEKYHCLIQRKCVDCTYPDGSSSFQLMPCVDTFP